MFYTIKDYCLKTSELKGVPYYWGEAETLEKGANCFTLSNYCLFRQIGKILVPPKDYYITYPSDNHLPNDYVKDVCYDRLGEPDNPNMEKEACLVLLKFENKYGVGATFKEDNLIKVCMTGSYGAAKSTVHSVKALRRHFPVYWSIKNNPEAIEVSSYFGHNKNGRPILNKSK